MLVEAQSFGGYFVRLVVPVHHAEILPFLCLCVCIHVYVCVCLRVRVRACVCVCMYIYIHTYIHMSTYIHTHTHSTHVYIGWYFVRCVVPIHNAEMLPPLCPAYFQDLNNG